MRDNLHQASTMHTSRLMIDPFSEGPEVSFDWFLSPEYLLPFIEETLEKAEIGKEARVLMLGCGNSSLSEYVGARSLS